MESSLNVRPVEEGSSRLQLPPRNEDLVRHVYFPSPDGINENLLILFHGLGDTHVPFAKLGNQLHLPQTATLSLRAPEKVPYLYEEAYQWYESFDSFGELLTRPNPTQTLELLKKFLDHLVQDCHWRPNKIHLFGFGQGGSLAAEIGLQYWRIHSDQGQEARLGSIVSVAGPLLSYPTLPSPCTTPVLLFHRPASAATKLSPGDLRALGKGYVSVREVTRPSGEGMPGSKEEWEPIMEFWSTNLSKWHSPGLYEVFQGGPPQ